MQTKLTLRLDSTLIRRAKEYAHQSGKSVSSVVAAYFASLGGQGNGRKRPTPKSDSLYGILRSSKKTVDESHYYKYLEKKYK